MSENQNEKDVVTDADIRSAIATLQKAESEMVAKAVRHWQHKKEDRYFWAMRGCRECHDLVLFRHEA